MRKLHVHAQGLDVQRKQAEPFSIEEENKLWSDSLLGADSPQILLDTMVLICVASTLLFRMVKRI